LTKKADSGHPTYFGVCLLLRVEPPFLIGADPLLKTQPSFIQNFLLVGRLGANSEHCDLPQAIIG
jgi:hypothetical protein